MSSSPKWSQSTRVIVILVSLILLGLLLYVARPLIGPIIIAILLAYLLDPIVDFIKSRSPLSHKWSAAIVYFIFLTLLITAISTLVPVLFRQAVNLTADLTSVENYVSNLLSQPIVILGQEYQLTPTQLTELMNNITQSLTPAIEDAFGVVENTSAGFVWTLVIFVSSYYFLLEWPLLNRWLINMAPQHSQEDARRLLQEINTVWRAYVRGTLALMLIVGIAFTIALTAVGLPGALAIGIISGLLIVLPELGPLLSGVLAVVVAYFQGSTFLPMSNFWFAVLVGIIYFILMQIRAIWLQPRLLGRFLHLHPGLVFVVLIATLVLQGAMAALFIIPLLASVGIIARYIRCKLLDLDPWPADGPTLTKGLLKESEEPPKPAWLEGLEKLRKEQQEKRQKRKV